VSKAMPLELSPVAEKELPPLTNGGSADLKNADDITVEKEEKKLSQGVGSDRNSSNDPPKERDKSNLPAHEIPENSNAYKYWQPEKIEPLTDPKRAIDLLNSALTMPPPPTLTREAEHAIDKLNSWLKDPILYPEALKRAKNNGYSIEFNENGRAVRISEPEF